MDISQQVLNVSAEVAETVHRNRRMIRDVAYLCAGSERELASSYDLLRKVRRSISDAPAPKPFDVKL